MQVNHFVLYNTQQSTVDTTALIDVNLKLHLYIIETRLHDVLFYKV